MHQQSFLDTRKYTLQKSNQGFSEISIDSYLAEQRIITLTGSITQQSAIWFSKQIADLLLKDSTKPIKILLDSTGGSIEAGNLILDVIQGSPVPVSVYCLNQAYSMAAVIFCVATGGRYMLPTARLMIHQPSIMEVTGTAAEIEQISNFLQENKTKLFTILAEHSDFTLEELEQKATNDLYLTAKEAVSRKLSDRIVTFAEIIQ